jgi:hypothetical protein
MSSANATPSIAKLAQSPTWQLLVHNYAGKARIDTNQFLLTAGDFSPQAELEQTLQLYQQNPQQAFCRYPARIRFLSNKLQLPTTGISEAACSELHEYRTKVPFQQLELVFASEVLSSASSMMGHIFLKASGTGSKGQPVAHSLAYFTEIDTFNPLSLAYDSLIAGMPGFFTVRPFQQDRQQYIENEQRNLWTFQLQGRPEDIELLQLHLWELRGVDITYYFQSFNCATLTLELLALLQPDILQERSAFVTPVDVVKAAHRHQMITQTHVDTSDLWLFHALNDVLSDAAKTQSLALIKTPRTDAMLQDARQPLYLEALANRAKNEQSLSETDYQRLSSYWLHGPTLDLSHYKHPALTPQDSAWSYSLQQNAIGHGHRLSYLASGHLLTADNRQYLSESELLIGQLAVSYQQRWQLEEATLYAVRSFTPTHDVFSALSGEFYLGWRQAYRSTTLIDSRLTRGLFELSGSAGQSYKPHPDLLLYALAGAGVGHGFGTSRVFGHVKTGLIMDSIYSSKLLLQYTASSAKTDADSRYQELSINWSWFASQNDALGLGITHLWIQDRHEPQLQLTYSHMF